MKTILKTLLLFAYFPGIKANAQDTASYLKPAQVKINLNYLGGSVSYEQRVSSSNTLYFDAGIGYGFTYQATYYGDINNTNYQYRIKPAITAELRHYYHFKERLAKNRSVANNGSNFFALKVNYIFEPVGSYGGLDHSAVIGVMPGWGIQRTLGKYLTLELELGLQASYELSRYAPSSTQLTVGPGAAFKIGYLVQ